LNVPRQGFGGKRATDKEHERGNIVLSPPTVPLVDGAQRPPVLDHVHVAVERTGIDEPVLVEDHDNAADVPDRSQMRSDPLVHGSTRTASRSERDGIFPRESRYS